MAEKKKGFVGRSSASGSFVLRDSKTGVFRDVDAPGLRRTTILDRDTFNKASAKAGVELKTFVGKRTKGVR
jgi:hypothetical protein